VAQLHELANIVLGIRLFNRHIGKGGAGIKDVPRIAAELVASLVGQVVRVRVRVRVSSWARCARTTTLTLTLTLTLTPTLTLTLLVGQVGEDLAISPYISLQLPHISPYLRRWARTSRASRPCARSTWTW